MACGGSSHSDGAETEECGSLGPQYASLTQCSLRIENATLLFPGNERLDNERRGLYNRGDNEAPCGAGPLGEMISLSIFLTSKIDATHSNNERVPRRIAYC